VDRINVYRDTLRRVKSIFQLTRRV